MLGSRLDLVLCLLIGLDKGQVREAFKTKFLMGLLPVSCPFFISLSLLKISFSSIVIISYNVQKCVRILRFLHRWTWPHSPQLVMLSPIPQGRDMFRFLFLDLMINRCFLNMRSKTFVLVLQFTRQVLNLLFKSLQFLFISGQMLQSRSLSFIVMGIDMMRL